MDLWEQIGCPPEFDVNTPYETGETVTFEEVVYECISTFSGRCNQAGWEPAVGQYWEEAWTALGSCMGTSECDLIN